MEKIANNLRVLRALKKLTQEDLAAALDITRARIGSYEEGRSEPPVEVLIKYSDFFHVAVDALVRGDLSKTRPEDLIRVGKNRLLFPITVDAEGNDLIELIPVKAHAGYLNGYSDPEYIENLQRMKLPFLAAGKHRTFPIKGDSMPPLKEGSYVVGKYVDSLKDVKDGNTYVLLTKNEGLVYKRVYTHLKKEPFLMLHSDNKTYSPFQVKAEDVLEIWEYTCSLNIGTYKEDELNMESILSMLKGMQVELQRIRK